MNRRKSLGGGARGFIPLKGKNVGVESPTKSKIAFTLAEVLITLGIIGIVAAMTLPTLINKSEQAILAKQFKKSYANLQNAINLAQSENGDVYRCYAFEKVTYNLDECQEFWQAVLSKMKVVKKCSGLDFDCHPRYKTKEEVLAQRGEINNNCSFNIATDSVNYYILADGSQLGVYNNITDQNHHIIYFTIDVNGKKGPNKWGYDIFYLNLLRESLKKSTVALSSICQIKEEGGHYFSEMILK